MPAEVTAFRANVGAWLLGIDGMSTLVGTRVFYGWPLQGSAWPMVTYALRRTQDNEYSAHAWGGQTMIAVYGTNDDDIDAVEDLILNRLEDAGHNVLSDLSSADITCHMFHVTEVTAPVYAPVLTDEGIVEVSRVIVCEHKFVASAANQ